jgi:hypothetical protein
MSDQVQLDLQYVQFSSVQRGSGSIRVHKRPWIQLFIFVYLRFSHFYLRKIRALFFCRSVQRT